MIDYSGYLAHGVKPKQEDAWGRTELGPDVLLCVADGIGGMHPCAEDASAIVVHACANYSRRHAEDFAQAPREALLNALSYVDAALKEYSQAHEQCVGLASTAALAYVSQERLDATVTLVGDCYAFHIHGWQMRSVHARHIDRRGCTTSLGCAYSPPGSPVRVRLEEGEWLLLSTDGIDVLRRQEIGAVVRASRSARDVTRGLADAVLEKGRPYRDDLAVVAVRIH